MRIFLFQILALFFLAPTGSAQESVPQFTVQVGNFVNPKSADFAPLRSMGFVYATQRPSNYMDVFMGGYSTETAANKTAEALKNKGYDNAFVSKLNVEGGQSVTVIQLVTKTVGDKINWDDFAKIERLYVHLNDNQIKIMTGLYPDIATAKGQLARLESLGFKGAFPRNINNALLHEVGVFEAGNIAKKPLIPLDFSDNPADAKKSGQPEKAAVPKEYNDETIIASNDNLTPKGVVITAPPPAKAAPAKATSVNLMANATTPDIRAGVKRTSAIELQKVLKAEGSYKGSLDGFYGKGTKTAYEVALKSNRQLEKYRLLAKHSGKPEDDAAKGTLQFFINNLWEEPTVSLDGLEKSKAPLAKAYRAYFLFVNDGASKDVNQLMNDAIKDAFAGKKNVDIPRFDPTATYAYYDIKQLLEHIGHLHSVSPGQVAAPCWLFSKHPGTALKAFEGSNVKIQSCGGFWEWEEVRVLNTMAQDISGQGDVSEEKLNAAQSQLSVFYLKPTAYPYAERKELENWNVRLWKGMDGWASRDPMLAEMNTALKISYFQTQVLLEDYFMDEGYSELDAKGLAIGALKSLVGYQLERFM